jgi:hypothetical protein
MDNLPIYKISIDPELAGDGEELGISMIAFVEEPAILVKGVAFKGNALQFFADATKKRIAAPALIPMQIYRNDSWGEYYVEFTQEEIGKLHEKLMQNLSKTPNVFNLEHDPKSPAPAFILECWLVGEDPKADRSYSEFGIEVPTGSLMLVAQVTDEEYYNDLVESKRTGFSIEGILGMKLSEKIKNKKNKMKKSLKNKKRFNAEFAVAGTDVAQDLTIVANEIAAGQAVIVIDAELTPVTDWTGEVVIDGAKIVIEEGVISEVITEEVEEIEEVEMAAAEEEIEGEITEEEMEKVEEDATYAITPEEQTLIVNEVMTILEAKFEEIYSMISEVKSMITGDTEAVEEATEEVAMSAHQKFMEINRFLKKSR